VPALPGRRRGATAINGIKKTVHGWPKLRVLAQHFDWKSLLEPELKLARNLGQPCTIFVHTPAALCQLVTNRSWEVTDRSCPWPQGRGGATAFVPCQGPDDPAYAWPLTRTPGAGAWRWINDRETAERYFEGAAPEVG
jgi:hypothetical protein